MKKIVGATSKRLPGFIFCFNISIFIHFFKYKTIETNARTYLPLNISAVCSVKTLTIKILGHTLVKTSLWDPCYSVFDQKPPNNSGSLRQRTFVR